MSERKPLEEKEVVAFDFVINALLQHEKSLSNLASVLERILKQLGKVGDVNAEIHEIEDKLSTIEQGLSNFKLLPYTQKPGDFIGNPIIAKCKQWEDFKVLATNAEIISFLLQEKENTLQVSVLKDVFMPTCERDFPKELSQDKKTLKTWLSRELNASEDRIFEGSLLPR